MHPFLNSVNFLTIFFGRLSWKNCLCRNENPEAAGNKPGSIDIIASDAKSYETGLYIKGVKVDMIR